MASFCLKLSFLNSQLPFFGFLCGRRQSECRRCCYNFPILTLIHLIDLQVSAEVDLSNTELEASINLTCIFFMIFWCCGHSEHWYFIQQVSQRASCGDYRDGEGEAVFGATARVVPKLGPSCMNVSPAGKTSVGKELGDTIRFHLFLQNALWKPNCPQSLKSFLILKLEGLG